ncbi:MAG: hypothetical protein Q8S31_06735 [Alphaproteobacteria bacterium]|nr:hypothetical protein [Alphaproteobacteria bacterium]
MKKLFVALATIISVSSFAEAAKIVIKNDSIYNVSYGTSYPAAANPFGTSISPGQYVIFDLPDNMQSEVFVRRWSLKGAAKTAFGLIKRVYTAVAPNKDNAVAYGQEVIRFGGEEVYNRLAFAKKYLNPSLVTEEYIKVVLVENHEEGTDTIKLNVLDDLIANYPGVVVNTEVTPSSAPVLMLENIKDEVEVLELVDSLTISEDSDEEPVIEEID